MITLTTIAEFKKSGLHCVVLRDQDSHWYVKVDDVTTQKRLNASEIVRYLANMMHEN